MGVAESLLEGRRVLVTGAARGIGRAIADEAARRGAAVAMADLDAVEDPPSGAAVIRCDLSSPHGADDAVAAARSALGGLDAVLNVAGVLGRSPIDRTAPAEWDALVSIHVSGTLALIRAALPALRESGSGRFVAFTSAAGLTGGGDMAAYSASKHAVVGAVRALAPRLAAEAITVNAISPTADTRMFRATPHTRSEIPAGLDPAIARREPRDVAPFACLLASRRAAHVTGRVFVVSGGYVIECEAPRRYKTVAGAAAVGELMRWVIGRPAVERIGYGPTRRFEIVEPLARFGDA